MGYRVVHEDSQNGTVHIVDDGLGRSVTNMAEIVVAELQIEYPGRQFVYRDTDGRWNELVHSRGVFVDFGPWLGWVPTNANVEEQK